MDCRALDQDELVENYLGGKLDPAAQDEFEVHLLECAGCQQAVEVGELVARDLAERAHEIRAQTPVHHPVHHPWFGWKWAAVAAVLVVGGSLGLLSLRHGVAAHPVPAARTAASAGVPGANQGSNDAQASQNTQNTQNTKTTALSGGTSAAPSQSLSSSAQVRSKAETFHLRGKDAWAVQRKSKSPSGQMEAGGGPPTTRGTEKSASVTKSDDSQAPALPVAQSTHEATNPTENLGSASTANPELASNAAAAEQFRLGTIQPLPYTFSGQAGSGKLLGASPGALVRPKHTLQPAESVRSAFKAGMNAYVNRQYADAAAKLELAVQLEPNAADANLFLGICKILLGHPADAISPLKTATTDAKSPWRQSAHYYLAKAYVQTGDLAQADSEFGAAAAIPGRLTAEAHALQVRVQALPQGSASPASAH
jgi:hypothetical protein